MDKRVCADEPADSVGSKGLIPVTAHYATPDCSSAAPPVEGPARPADPQSPAAGPVTAGGGPTVSPHTGTMSLTAPRLSPGSGRRVRTPSA